MSGGIDFRSMRRPILLLAALAAFACGGGSSIPADADLADYTFVEQDVPFIGVDDLKGWIDAGHADDVVFLDNRNSMTFREQRIEGARLVPTDQVEAALPSLPLNKWLIFYCT